MSDETEYPLESVKDVLARVEELEGEIAAYQERYAELDNLRDQGYALVPLPRAYVEHIQWLGRHPDKPILKGVRKALMPDDE